MYCSSKRAAIQAWEGAQQRGKDREEVVKSYVVGDNTSK